jgi:hypothetical protein
MLLILYISIERYALDLSRSNNTAQSTADVIFPNLDAPYADFNIITPSRNNVLELDVFILIVVVHARIGFFH